MDKRTISEPVQTQADRIVILLDDLLFHRDAPEAELRERLETLYTECKRLNLIKAEEKCSLVN